MQMNMQRMEMSKIQSPYGIKFSNSISKNRMSSSDKAHTFSLVQLYNKYISYLFNFFYKFAKSWIYTPLYQFIYFLHLQ